MFGATLLTLRITSLIDPPSFFSPADTNVGSFGVPDLFFSQNVLSCWKCFLGGVLSFASGDYTIIDFNEVDIRIYLPEKVIIH